VKSVRTLELQLLCQLPNFMFSTIYLLES